MKTNTHNVRSHTRRVNGRDVRVNQHTHSHTGAQAKSKGTSRPAGKNPKKGPSLARRGWGNVVKAFRHAKKKQKWYALGFGVLAIVEILSYVLLQTTAAALVTVSVAAIGTAAVANGLANGGGTKKGK